MTKKSDKNYLNNLISLNGNANIDKKINTSIISLWRPILFNDILYILGPGVNNTGFRFNLLNILKIYIISRLFGGSQVLNFYINKYKNKKLIFIGTIYNYYSGPEIFDYLMNESDKKIFIQHGGNYGEYINNKYEELDKKYSDIFFHWSLEKDGLRQTRFGYFHHLITLKNSIRYFGGYIRLVMYSREKGPSNMASNSLRCSLSKNFIDCLSLDVCKNKLVIHEHPENKENCNGLHIDNIKYSTSRIGDVAGRNDLIVFDGPSHTFMYYCIENKIPFIMLWREEFFTGMTENFIEFYIKLISMGVVVNSFERCINIKYLTSKAKAASEILYIDRGRKYLCEYLSDY